VAVIIVWQSACHKHQRSISFYVWLTDHVLKLQKQVISI